MENQTINPYEADPSHLTTAQLLREIGSLKELVFIRIEAIEDVIKIKITAVEDGIKIAHEDLVRVPTDTQLRVGDLKELLVDKINSAVAIRDEKLLYIEKQFILVEQARIEQKKDTRIAVDDALKAAKELVAQQNESNTLAINKREIATTKQMDQQEVLLQQIKSALTDKIEDVKVRLTQMESIGTGRKMAGTELIAWISVGILIIGFLISFYAKIKP